MNTQKSYANKLTEYGPPDGVFELVSEYALYDQRFATQFAAKDMDAGTAVTPDDVLEMTLFLEKHIFEHMYEKEKIDIFADKDPEETFDPEINEDNIFSIPQQKKPGFFSRLLGAIDGVSLASGAKEKHCNRRCNGDCTNCLRHYDYHFGHWYYRHKHAHGCEFGGNKGNSRMTKLRKSGCSWVK